MVVIGTTLHGYAAASSWQAVKPIYGGPVNAVVVDSGGTVYATASSGIFKSSDSGGTWVSATGDLPVLSVQAITADPVNPGTLYAGTNRAMFKTTNGGSHWTTLAIPDGTSINQIAVARSNPSYVYASTGGSYVYRSTDGGSTWAQSSSGLSGGWSGPSFTTVMAVDPTNPLRAYTATWRGHLFRSDDGANSWQAIGGGATYWIGQIAVAPSASNVLWAINDAAYTSFANILKSADSGASWSNQGQPAGSEDGASIAVDRSNPDVAYVATGQGLYKSSGGGAWTLLFIPPAGPVGLNSVVIDPTHPLQFYVGSAYSGPYVSTDSGSTWRQSVNGYAAASITSIDFCTANPSVVYAAAQTVGLLKSTDGGSTWASVGGNAGFQSQYLGEVAVHPYDPNQVLLSTGSGIWRSTDGAVSFSAVSSSAYSPFWLRFSPLAASNAMASISDWQGGFLFSSTSGSSWTIPQSIYIYPHDYAFHPSYSNVVFATADQYTGAAQDTLYIMWSNSGGNGGWQQSAAAGKGTMQELALDQSDPTVLYAAGAIASEGTQGVYKFSVSYSGSTVTGVTRVAGTFNNGLGNAVPRRLAYNVATSTLYLTTDRGVFRSTDRAATWVPINDGLTYLSTDALALAPDGTRVIVGTNGGIWEYGVGSSPPIIITPSPLPLGRVGVPYSQTLIASGGTPPYTNWSITGGTQPPGLSLSSVGVLSGTATTAGAYNLTARVTDSAGATASASFQLTISPSSLAITTTSPMPAAQVNAAYTQTLGASGGTPPYTWATTGGTLPPGLSLSSVGVLSGTPTAASTYTFSARVIDSAGATASASFQLTITTTGTPGGAALSIQNAAGPPGGTVDVPITLTASGSSIAGFQTDVAFDSQVLTFKSATAGAAASGAGKTLSAQSQGSGTVRLTCFGLSQNSISDGTVATLNFGLSNSFSSGSSSTISCSNTQGSDPQGHGVTLACSLGKVTSGGCTCDVNKDGIVNVADVQVEINVALGLSNVGCDLNGDGKVDIADVQIVINSALGMGCKGH